MTWAEFKKMLEHSGVLDTDNIRFIVTGANPEPSKLHIEKIHDCFCVYNYEEVRY